MGQFILPASLNPITRRKDKSVKLSLETRELTPEETLTLMAMEGAEMWICLAPNESELEVPTEPAELEGKSLSERLRSVQYVMFDQMSKSGEYVGTFENFRRERMEKLIKLEKSFLNE